MEGGFLPEARRKSQEIANHVLNIISISILFESDSRKQPQQIRVRTTFVGMYTYLLLL